MVFKYTLSNILAGESKSKSKHVHETRILPSLIDNLAQSLFISFYSGSNIHIR